MWHSRTKWKCLTAACTSIPEKRSCLESYTCLLENQPWACIEYMVHNLSNIKCCQNSPNAEYLIRMQTQDSATWSVYWIFKSLACVCLVKLASSNMCLTPYANLIWKLVSNPACWILCSSVQNFELVPRFCGWRQYIYAYLVRVHQCWWWYSWAKYGNVECHTISLVSVARGLASMDRRRKGKELGWWDLVFSVLRE